ncbi:efflux RND transporter permease subunit [Halomonas vilamensis]|uniref:Efflux RND transporter permease subunit n=1 Tax=Vreelandella vilamensis TaxID=531309 RepID=A0ABU1H6U1_9GAMM|nr:efflux RND transporter permease subunit [Halomonas vilamensis]MDR5900011.1 efflux RND transporter permease subunit [Halomonas vilamensis]
MAKRSLSNPPPNALGRHNLRLGLAGHIANRLLDSPVVPLFVVACLLLGGYALLVTPREDRPDIDTPTATVLIPWPGAGVERVDEQLARRTASWVREIASVEEIRSASSSHAALLTVEFVAGTPKAEAFSELEEIFQARAEELPQDTTPPRINVFGESRLVVFLATLSSKTVSFGGLEDIATELAANLERVPGVRSVESFGGERAAIEVLPKPTELAARAIPLNRLAQAIAGANQQLPIGRLENPPTTDLQVGITLNTLEQLSRIPVGEGDTGPVYLDEVASIENGRIEENQAVLHWQQDQSAPFPAVTLAVTTLEGMNVSDVTQNLQEKVTQFSNRSLPSEVALSVSHDAGIDATQRVYNVLVQLLTGTLVVVGIIWLGLGWRAAVVIAIMMPASLSIVPYLYNRFDFTLNPVSIAAMILAIGILSDDAVVMLENVARHFRRAGEKSRELTVKAVNEVGNPTILADILVVATLLPTAYISGEMGQYVRAIPIGASAAVLFSLLVALTITPYFGLRLLRVEGDKSQSRADSDEKQREAVWVGYYRRLLSAFITYNSLRWLFYLILMALLLASLSLIGLRIVQVGLTPLLDRNVFAVNIELPPESTLSESLTAASALNRHLKDIPEVKAVTLYSGLAAPMIYPPEALTSPEEKAPRDLTLHVELVEEEQRDRQSYEINREIAHNLKRWLAPYAGQGHISRIPSGPSSDRAITAEIYGADPAKRQATADRVEQWLSEQQGIVSTQQQGASPLPLLHLEVNPERAATFGVLPADVARTLALAIHGETLGSWSGMPHSREPIPIVLRLAKPDRVSEQAIKSLYVTSVNGRSVPLESLMDFRPTQGEQARFRRGLMPVTTVYADLDRSVAQPLTVQFESLRGIGETEMDIRWLSPPNQASEPVLYWSGEWEMTRDVYRDLGVAGLAVMVLIYVLLAGWFRSYRLPILIMLPIPLVFIGVIPAHWAWGINIAGTGILGVIALGGIVTRNAILLVDFIEKRLDEGMALKEAVIQAGVQRTRPILLTAATVMFGSGVLVFEPSLKPLGLTLASGVLISTVLTLVLIPLLYFHAFSCRSQQEDGQTH